MVLTMTFVKVLHIEMLFKVPINYSGYYGMVDRPNHASNSAVMVGTRVMNVGVEPRTFLLVGIGALSNLVMPVPLL